MLTRREMVAAAFASGLLPVAGANAADPAARSFLTSIYNSYKGKNGNGVRLDSEAAIKHYFEPALAALIIKDQKEAEGRGEVPALDADPFVDAQDWEIASFDIAVEDTGPSKARGTVKFQNMDKAVTVLLDLVKLREGWRISDITWQRDNGTSTLRALFVQP